MQQWQLAQLNIAQLAAPIDSPSLADFVNNLDAINQLAEQSDGFIWRLQLDIREANERLIQLRQQGPCANAFTFKVKFVPGSVD